MVNKTTDLKPGDTVRHHPTIGGRHDGKVYTIKAIQQLRGDQHVAWINERPACVALADENCSWPDHDEEHREAHRDHDELLATAKALRDLHKEQTNAHN